MATCPARSGSMSRPHPEQGTASTEGPLPRRAGGGVSAPSFASGSGRTAVLVAERTPGPQMRPLAGGLPRP